MEALVSRLLDIMFNSTVSGGPYNAARDISLRPQLLLLGPMCQLLGSILLLPWVPTYIRTSAMRTHKWRFTFLARIAAGVSSILAVIVLQQSFALRSDFMYGSSQMGVDLIMLSLGIHIAETIDMILISNVSMLFIHHLITISNGYYPY